MKVLFLNDSPEAVVVGSPEFEKEVLREKKEAYAKLNPHVSSSALYWHYHEVPIIKEKK